MGRKKKHDFEPSLKNHPVPRYQKTCKLQFLLLTMADIVIAEDDQLILNLATRVLERAGHTCKSFDLKHRDPQPYLETQVLMTDYNLPGTSGIEIINNFVKLNYQGSIILCTGFPQEHFESCPLYTQLPHITFLQKPYEVDGLLAAVNSALHDTHRT